MINIWNAGVQGGASGLTTGQSEPHHRWAGGARRPEAPLGDRSGFLGVTLGLNAANTTFPLIDLGVEQTLGTGDVNRCPGDHHGPETEASVHSLTFPSDTQATNSEGFGLTVSVQSIKLQMS